MSKRYCYQSVGEKPMMGVGWWFIILSVAILNHIPSSSGCPVLARSLVAPPIVIFPRAPHPN